MEYLSFQYSLVLSILLLLIIYFFLFSSIPRDELEDFDLVYTSNPFVSKGFHQLLGIPVPNDCPSCPSCPGCPSCQECPSITYNSVNELGNFNMSPWNMGDSSLSMSKWIWNVPNAQNNAPANVYIWFYCAFYVDVVSTYNLLAVSDDVGMIHFNDNPGRDISGGWNGNVHRRGVIGTSKQGFNYIKVCTFNQGGPAGLLISLQDDIGRNISSNGSWLTTTTTVYNKEQPVPIAKFVILGVGTDGQLWVKKSLNTSDLWKRVATDTRNDLISISVGADGRSILGVTRQNTIVTKPSWSASTWTNISFNCCVTSIGMDRRGRIFGLGMDRKVWTKDSLNGSWTQRASSGENGLFLSVGVNTNELYMIDMNSNVFKKTIPENIQNLASTSWYPFMNFRGIKGYIKAHDNSELMIDIGSHITTLTNNSFVTIQNTCCVNSICKPISFGDPDV